MNRSSTGFNTRADRVPCARRDEPLASGLLSRLFKSIAISDQDPQLFHYRDKSQREADFILSGHDGQATGIEVKAGLTVKKELFETLEMLIATGSIQWGVIIYNGERCCLLRINWLLCR